MPDIKPRPIKRLLVANRGEIATRILASARELDLETYALYTPSDFAHTHNATHAIRLDSAASYLDIPTLCSIVRTHSIDAVHPGYGFLSESPGLASQMAELNVLVIGPGAENLSRTGDKLAAKRLAHECNVPVLPALTEPTDRVEEVKRFAETNGLPIMIKAVDGGGGRGIRLVREMGEVEGLVRRAVEESGSRRVFAEKAAVDGYRHVEVQVVGDGRGGVRHLWERECSVQRRYQKVVELAPSTVAERGVVGEVIAAAVRMAQKINYASLGTFEFLLNPQTSEFFFLEINPRLQVEHTITESICSVDIVKAQLRLAQGASFAEAGLDELSQDPLQPPKMHSIQLRVTAEDPEKNYSLSIGKIQSFHFPSGNGVRVDTALHSRAPAVVSSDFDSVIAKIIITAQTWGDVVSKARRALDDTTITGINTNLALLRAIVAHPDFIAGACDTQWLEAHHSDLLKLSRRLAQEKPDSFHGLVAAQASSASGASVAAGSSTLFRKDDAWTIALKPHKPPTSNTTPDQQTQPHHLHLTKVLQNDFPTTFAAEILFTPPSSSPVPYTMHMSSTSASASATSSQHRRGNPQDSTHVILPLSGKLVEVLVDVGDVVKAGEAICVVRQMKMEVEVRSHRQGVVGWVLEVEEGEDVGEGMLGCIVQEEERKVEAKL